MKKDKLFLYEKGFTLIELLVFIIVSGILIASLTSAFVTGLTKSSVILKNMIASQTAQQCVEWLLGQRRLYGYNAIACNTTVPTFCTGPSSYTMTMTCSPTTINLDTKYKTYTFTVSGPSSDPSPGKATFTLLMGEY